MNERMKEVGERIVKFRDDVSGMGYESMILLLDKEAKKHAICLNMDEERVALAIFGMLVEDGDLAFADLVVNAALAARTKIANDGVIDDEIRDMMSELGIN